MTTTATALPPWLEEHCFRLQDDTSNILNLNLNIRRLDPDMMCALATALIHNPRIEIINLTSSLIHPNQTILPLADVLAYPQKSLQVIHLSYNRLEHAASIGDALRTNSTLQELYLDYNRVDSASAISLANGLRQNQTLRVLQLNSNSIGDVGGQALGNALKYNTTLQKLGLCRNQLGDASGRALVQGLVQDNNVTLMTLQLDGNPLLSPWVALLQYYVRANQVGRYMLGAGEDRIWSLWPLVLQSLEADMMFFFLREKPYLVQRNE
jgi:hypothetical protein